MVAVPKMTRRVQLNFGYAEYDIKTLTPIGDRLLPQRISVHFPAGGVGDEMQPALDISIDLIDGVPMCTSLALTKSPDGREVRSKDLRDIRIEDWLEYIVAACAHPYETDGATTRVDIPSSGPTAADLRRISDTRKPVRNANRGRRTIDREHLEKVAKIYREHFDDRPVKAIQKAWGVKPRTAAWWVELCRSDEYQLLPKADGKGKKTK